MNKELIKKHTKKILISGILALLPTYYIYTVAFYTKNPSDLFEKVTTEIFKIPYYILLLLSQIGFTDLVSNIGLWSGNNPPFGFYIFTFISYFTFFFVLSLIPRPPFVIVAGIIIIVLVYIVFKSLFNFNL